MKEGLTYSSIEKGSQGQMSPNIMGRLEKKIIEEIPLSIEGIYNIHTFEIVYTYAKECHNFIAANPDFMETLSDNFDYFKVVKKVFDMMVGYDVNEMNEEYFYEELSNHLHAGKSAVEFMTKMLVEISEFLEEED